MPDYGAMIRPIALSAAVVAAVALAAPSAQAQTPTTVHATSQEAARLLFVAGDVRRLSRTPSGTVDIVLEKVLQQEYGLDKTLAPDQAKSDIQSLAAKLSTDTKTSAATLSAIPGNQRILAVLAALNGSNTPRIQRAIAATADQALAESSASARNLGREFNPAADSVSTLLYGGFSPAKTLQATYDLAHTTRNFGEARDALWQAASHESVFDSSTALAANTDATVASDGSITTPVADVEKSVRDSLQDINARSTQAINDHRAIGRECPGPNCATYTDSAQAHGAEARAAISAQETTVAAAGGLLALLDAREGAAVQAEGQAAAQVASAFNSYFAAKDYGQYVHGAADVAGLLATLAVAEVDPAAAINGVLNVVQDVIGVAVPRPDATALILQGLQGVSQQLSAFAEETAAQFRAVDTRLATISNQISTLASQLSTQLAEVRTQLTGFGNALADLQSSVDRLHAEIQQLFAEDARNSLRQLVTESVGFQQVNRRPLPPDTFAADAAALFDHATATSLSQTVLQSPLSWNAPGAAAITDLDPSINFFALFPKRVTDSPVTWPALTNDCANGRCLPSPDYWAGASRSLAQLLLENRDAVTPAHITRLQNAVDAGTPLNNTLRKISANDDGANGTGSKLFNAALGYYDSWVGTNGDRPSGAPALLQALQAERVHYVNTQRPQGIDSKDAAFVDPWGGAQQPLGDVDVLGSQWLQNPKSYFPVGGFTIPDFKPVPELITRLPAAVLNAIRLNIGRLDVSWRATWLTPVAYGDEGSLDVRMDFRYHVAASATRPEINDDLGSVSVFRPFTTNCSTGPSSSSAEATFAAGWIRTKGCRDFAAEFRAAVGGPNQGGVYSHDDSGFAKTSADLIPLVDARLHELQTNSFKDLLADPKGLTLGDNVPARNVGAAAERVQGADTLIRGYVTLGLPQALATDDGLRGLLAGDGANALLHPTFDNGRAAPADTVQDQLVNYINYSLEKGIPQSDPFTSVQILFRRHRDALANAIGAYVKNGRAVGQDAADGGKLDEGNPLVTSTLDRLELTRAVLEDHLAHPPVHEVPVTPAAPSTPAAPAQSTPAKPAAKPTPARARLIRRPTTKGNTIRYTVACLSGTCRITTTVKAGRKSVAHPLTLKAGKRRTVTIRVKRRQTVTVTVRLAGTTRPLATKRLKIR
jgi:hypothetical protein